MAWSGAGCRPALRGTLFSLTTGIHVDKNINMKAELLYRFEQDFDDGAMVRMVIWEVPSPVPPSEHPNKYRLVYLENGLRVIGFDNERGKGDHRHDEDVESPYCFVDVPTLIKDFIDAVRQRRKV
jgi:hypothetical protein